MAAALYDRAHLVDYCEKDTERGWSLVGELHDGEDGDDGLPAFPTIDKLAASSRSGKISQSEVFGASEPRRDFPQQMFVSMLGSPGVVPPVAKNGFVFLGATGDNALRPSGVWSGLFESFAGGVFSESSVGIHVAMNAPHTKEELQTKVMTTLAPLYAELKNNSGWSCKATGGDCSPAAMLKDVQVAP